MVLIEALDWAFSWLDGCTFLRDWSWAFAIGIFIVDLFYYGNNLLYIRENPTKKETKRYKRAELHLNLSKIVIFIDAVFWLLSLHFLFL